MNPLDALFDRAAEDRRHGASEIEGRLIVDLLRERRWWNSANLHSGAERLLTGQPAMANLRNLARELARGNPEATERWMQRRSVLLSNAGERFAAAAWSLIENTSRLLTISRSSAVAAVLTGAWCRGWRGETVVFDGSPAGGGVGQTLRLAREMDHLRSQPDATMPGWFTREGTVVLVGADAVSPERLVNVSGTAVLLELAAARSVPVVVVADSGKDLPDTEIDELLAARPEITEDGTGRRWPIFEAIPFEFVSQRIRE